MGFSFEAGQVSVKFSSSGFPKVKGELDALERQLRQVQRSAQGSLSEFKAELLDADTKSVVDAVRSVSQAQQKRRVKLFSDGKFMGFVGPRGGLYDLAGRSVRKERVLGSLFNATGFSRYSRYVRRSGSPVDFLVRDTDAQVKYANADISEQIARLEQARSKVAKYSEDWNKVTDKIKELKSTQSATNELQMQLANAEPYKKATASLDFYLEEQKKAQNITDNTVNSYERLQRQKTAMSNTDNALSAVISQLNEKLSENWQNVNFVTAEFEKLGKMSGLTAAQLEQVTKAQKELNNAKDSKAVSNILYGVEIGALKAKDAMTELQATVTATMSAEGVKLEDYGKFSDQLKNQLAALGQVASQVVQPSMDMLQKQYETGILTLPAYIAQLKQLKTAYADIPAVVMQIDSTIKQANATGSTFATRMQSAIGDATKSFNELNSTALTGIADGFARAVAVMRRSLIQTRTSTQRRSNLRKSQRALAVVVE